MARPKHTPEIIIGKLREAEVMVAKGATVAEASRHRSALRSRRCTGGARNTAACVSTRRGG